MALALAPAGGNVAVAEVDGRDAGMAVASIHFELGPGVVVVAAVVAGPFAVAAVGGPCSGP